MVAKLKERLYWPGNFNDVQSWCATCSKCISQKTTPPHGRAPLQPVKVQYPMEMIAVDIIWALFLRMNMETVIFW